MTLADVPPESYMPSVQDVAALLRARTKDSTGVEVGTFNDDTRPTSAQAATMIDTAVNEVLVAVGPGPPDWLGMGIKSAATIKAAMLIELSYFPEQVQSSRSAYPEYAQLYQFEIQALQDAARGVGPGGMTTFSIAIPVFGETPAIVPFDQGGPLPQPQPIPVT